MEEYPHIDYILEKKGLANECTFKSGMDFAQCPHNMENRPKNIKIHDNILSVVGNTPLVRINNITAKEGIKCELLAKCEFLNPGGSVKDRIGRRMVLDAEKSGRIKKGDILIEPTSGNTGVGLAMTAASLGYKMIITMPEKMSMEKENTLRALGAEVVRTPTELPTMHVDSHFGVALKLNKSLPNSHILDQYKNPGNPLAHYQDTAQEIFDQCEGRLDYIVLGVGTGGTITGIGRRLKELDPNIKVIGVDPIGSILAQPENLNVEGDSYKVEGIGYDFIPRVLDREVIDEWYKSEDKDSFYWVRRLQAEEGFLAGASSGTAMWAAMQVCKKLPEGKRVVVILPDNVRNYMTKFINDDWMYECGFITEEENTERYRAALVPNNKWGQEYTIKDLELPEAYYLNDTQSIGEAIDELQGHSFDQFPIRDSDGRIIGVLTSSHLTDNLIKRKQTLRDPISLVMEKDFREVSSTIQLDELGRIFTRWNFVLVDGKYIVSNFDLLNFYKKKEA